MIVAKPENFGETLKSAPEFQEQGCRVKCAFLSTEQTHFLPHAGEKCGSYGRANLGRREEMGRKKSLGRKRPTLLAPMQVP
jgi:hypothetical protein